MNPNEKMQQLESEKIRLQAKANAQEKTIILMFGHLKNALDGNLRAIQVLQSANNLIDKLDALLEETIGDLRKNFLLGVLAGICIYSTVESLAFFILAILTK